MKIALAHRRVVAVVALAAFALALMGAKCIENDSLYVDSEGYTHIVGNMTNETDVSATSVTLSGTLYDAAGNVIATTTADVCPLSVQPKSQNAFDLRFAERNLPAPARYEVRPVAGYTIPAPLPSGNITLVGMAAYRVSGTLAVSGSVRNDGSMNFNELRYCSAAYNAQGKVIKVQASPLPEVLPPGASARVPVVWPELPAAATELVVWVSVGPTAQWVTPGRLPIQNGPPPR